MKIGALDQRSANLCMFVLVSKILIGRLMALKGLFLNILTVACLNTFPKTPLLFSARRLSVHKRPPCSHLSMPYRIVSFEELKGLRTDFLGKNLGTGHSGSRGEEEFKKDRSVAQGKLFDSGSIKCSI